MTTKTMPKVKKTRATNFVRLTLDDTLNDAIEETKYEFPMLDTAQIIRVLISRGIKKSKLRKNKNQFMSLVEDLQNQNNKLSPENNYTGSYKEAYHKNLDQKYGK
jgi:hypothetical protein